MATSHCLVTCDKWPLIGSLGIVALLSLTLTHALFHKRGKESLRINYIYIYM